MPDDFATTAILLCVERLMLAGSGSVVVTPKDGRLEIEMVSNA